MSEHTAENDAPLHCSVCGDVSDGGTYLEFIHAHAHCVTPPDVTDRGER